MSNISALGFNGEYLDSTLDNYHLGNGYRAYNPTTMQFTAPDDMSPFGHGGINPYVYCSGDPINNTDPTGHFAGFLGAIIGIINMVSPLQVPTSLTATGIEEAVMGTVVNVGVDLATDGLGAVATPVLRTVEGVARSTADDVIENVGQHAIVSGIPTSHDTRYMDKLLNWVYEKPENQRDYYSWLHDTTHQSDAPGPSRIDIVNQGEAQPVTYEKSINNAYSMARNSNDPRQWWVAEVPDGSVREYLMLTSEARRSIANNPNILKNVLAIHGEWRSDDALEKNTRWAQWKLEYQSKDNNLWNRQVGRMHLFSRKWNP